MSFFEEQPPPELDQKILRAAKSPLSENRRAHSRRRFIQWFSVPALGFAAAVALIFRVTHVQETPGPESAFVDFAEAESDEDLDMIAELDILEEWDELELMEDV